MKTLINLATLKKGGGQNVALNFLESLFRTQDDISNYSFICVKNSEIHSFLIEKKIESIILMPKKPLIRILKELLLGYYIIKKNKIDIIYSYFGIGLYPATTPQISGSADSNIYFPEINFWEDYKGLTLIKKKIIDNYRIWGIKKMKGIIFENKILEERSIKLYKLKNTIFIQPSINLNFENNQYNLDFKINNFKIGLFLCGWQKNKNYMLIPKIAAELKSKNINFQFIITANKDNSIEHLDFIKQCKKLDVEEKIHIIGNIKKNQLKSLYYQIDFVFLLSKLESFSNNIIEAWEYKKPIIISNELWSKSICKNAAIYVNRNNEKDISNQIENYINNENKRKELISNGEKLLLEYPTIDQKTKQELEYIKKVYENN